MATAAAEASVSKQPRCPQPHGSPSRRAGDLQRLPSIVPAGLGDTAGRLGAGLLAWDLLNQENMNNPDNQDNLNIA